MGRGEVGSSLCKYKLIQCVCEHTLADVTDLDSQDLSQGVIVIKTSVLILCCYMEFKICWYSSDYFLVTVF